MELEQLRTRARAMLATARQDLRKTKNVQPTVLLLDPIDCSGEQVVLIEGEIMDDPRRKAALGERIRALADEHGYTACIFASDVWSPGEMRPAQTAQVEAVQALYHCTLHKACKLLGIFVYEMINVEVQTLGPCVSLRQTYWRDSRGRVIEFEAAVEQDAEAMRGLMWFLSDRRVDGLTDGVWSPMSTR